MKIPVAQPDPRRVLKAAVLVSFLSLGMPSVTTAQEPEPEGSSPRHYMSANLFGYLERSEDGLSGQTFGLGGSLGTFLTERLSLEIEAARARFLSAAQVGHRDYILTGLVAFHLGADRRTGPVLLAGASLWHSQKHSHFRDLDATMLAPTLGLDWRVPLGRRLQLVAQTRLHIPRNALIFRPGVGVRWAF